MSTKNQVVCLNAYALFRVIMAQRADWAKYGKTTQLVIWNFIVANIRSNRATVPFLRRTQLQTQLGIATLFHQVAI